MFSSLTVRNYRWYFCGQAAVMAAAPEMRGRVMALWAIAWGGSTVIGGPIVGWLAEALGGGWSLIVGGLPTLLLGLVMLRPYAASTAPHPRPRPPPPLQAAGNYLTCTFGGFWPILRVLD
jgi:MFS family permease